MHTIANRVALALAILAGAGFSTAQDLNVKWDNGIKIQSADKQFDFKIGGRVHHDWAFISNDDTIGGTHGGAEFRRARLYIKGSIWNNIELQAQYDFAGGDADFKNVYLGLTGLPGNNAKLRVGQYKEPAGLEELTSSNDITLMERSLISSLVPSYQTGISYRDAYGEKKAEHLTYVLGIFRNSNSYGDAKNTDSYNIGARVTGLAMQNKDKQQLLHLGGSFSIREFDPGGATISSNREIHLGNQLLSTNLANAEDAFVFGLEAAFAQGPFSAQAEWISADIDLATGSDPTLSGYYVQVAYTLTGEARSYKHYDGVFGSITPAKNFGKDGKGAVEVAARYSFLDFDFPTGELTSFALGCNWYLNPNTRVMTNYVLSDRDGSGAGTGEESAVQFRFQVNF